MITILFLAANPSDTTRLRLAEEIRQLDDVLQKARYRDHFDLKSHWAVRSGDLQGLLLRHQPNIVHFSGHGSEEGAIVLEDGQERSQTILPRSLRASFGALRGQIRCVLLNACYSEIQAREIVKEAGIVIGMTDAISDDAALSFSSSFYQALAFGHDVKTAFDLGCEQIQLDQHDEESKPKLLHARNVRPSEVKFVQSASDAPPPARPVTKLMRWEIVIPAVVTIIAALIGIIPPLMDRIWPVATPTAISTPQPVSTNTVTLGQSVVTSPLMPSKGFNLVLAGFLEQTATGVLTVSAASQAIDEWLFDVVNNEAAKLPTALSYEVRGPRDVEPIDGVTPEERAMLAQQFAEQNNITLLIYGVISNTGSAYLLLPEFYVSGGEFAYGSEISGNDRLGKPVNFQLPITSGTLFTGNRQLNARTQVLRQFILGLAYYYVGDYSAAQDSFREGLTTPDWKPNEGQEVAYLLIGAAALGEYNSITNRSPLLEARKAFEQANTLNPQYARAMLGLGAVSLQEAGLPNADGTGIGNVDDGKLLEAQNWYLASSAAKEKRASYFVDLKAAFGQGQVQLLGYEFGRSGFDKDQAHTFFQQVIDQGQGYSMPSLVWYVGSAHKYLGRIAGLEQNFVQMVEELQRSNDILSGLAPNAPLDIIARNWASIGFAEAKQGQTTDANDAYCRAVESGKGSVSDKELASWSANCVKGG